MCGLFFSCCCFVLNAECRLRKRTSYACGHLCVWLFYFCFFLLLLLLLLLVSAVVLSNRVFLYGSHRFMATCV